MKRCVILDSGVMKIENSSVDRRKSNLPVENDRRSGVDRRSAPRNEHHHSKLSYAFEALPPVRRLFSVPDKLENGDIFPAVGAAGLALVNLPEDLRDIKEAGKQIKALIKHGKYDYKYNYKEYQHPFSFFRGTFLHNLANPNTSKHPRLAKWLEKFDKPLSDTKFGEWIFNKLNVELIDSVETPIKHIIHSEKAPVFIEANKYSCIGKFSRFGELTARAFERATLPGIAIFGLLELPSIIKAAQSDEGIGKKTENIVRQTFKSGVNVASTTAGIAYGGALGFKKFGPTGSLVGMGLGAILGNKLAKTVQAVAD